MAEDFLFPSWFGLRAFGAHHGTNVVILSLSEDSQPERSRSVLSYHHN